MPVKKTIKVDTKELKSYARRVARREANLRPVWGKIFDELADAHRRTRAPARAVRGGSQYSSHRPAAELPPGHGISRRSIQPLRDDPSAGSPASP